MANQHVVRRGNEWAVLGERNSKDTSLHQTQKAAINAARVIAINKKAEVVIHGLDGKIRDKDSYGPDPVSSKDKKY